MTTKTTIFSEIESKINNKTFTLGVVGLGYVGLPLACEFIHNKITVFGFDISEDKVNQLISGESYIHDISNDTVQACMDSKQFIPTTDFSKINDVDVISICVPTPLRKTKDPDMSYIVSAVNSIANHLKDGYLLIY